MLGKHPTELQMNHQLLAFICQSFLNFIFRYFYYFMSVLLENMPVHLMCVCLVDKKVVSLHVDAGN